MLLWQERRADIRESGREGMSNILVRAAGRFLPTRKRFVLPVFGFALVHLVIGLVLYYSLQAGGSFSVPFMKINPSSLPFDWLYLFSAWDSEIYRDIALNWYPPKLSPHWAFFPLYPATVRLLSFVGVNAGLGAFTVAVICGFGSVIVFQEVAERYMVRAQAFVATSLYFLFPPVFVFSVASYPQSMFLLLALLSWHFHKEHSELKACIAAGLCALTRAEGFLLAIPLLYDYLSERKFKNVVYALVPLSATAAWELYGLALTGVSFPSLAAGKFWNTPNVQAIKLAIQQLAGGNLSSVGVLLPYGWLIVSILGILAVVFLLAWRNLKIDRALSVYLVASTLILGATLSIAYRSFPRILSFFFPVGLPLHTDRVSLLVALTLIFLVLDYIAWFAFLTDGFY